MRCTLTIVWITENPIPKFGEALRAQAEEFCRFSEDLALEENESDGHTAQPYDQDLQ